MGENLNGDVIMGLGEEWGVMEGLGVILVNGEERRM